jgi:hypothetical protein
MFRARLILDAPILGDVRTSDSAVLLLPRLPDGQIAVDAGHWHRLMSVACSEIADKSFAELIQVDTGFKAPTVRHFTPSKKHFRAAGIVVQPTVYESIPSGAELNINFVTMSEGDKDITADAAFLRKCLAHIGWWFGISYGLRERKYGRFHVKEVVEEIVPDYDVVAPDGNVGEALRKAGVAGGDKTPAAGRWLGKN